jgi:GH24 family phage-related lysozyme (muramidase)
MAVEPQTAAAPPDDAEWRALLEVERQALRQRRRAVLGFDAAGNFDELELPRVGLALSGGGVRSATFALGLLRGLAQSRNAAHPGIADPSRRSLVTDSLLGRLDYLSSVSGGGYVAGMYGRLVSTFGLRTAQQRMADSESPVLDWLRRNGRYLTPAGSRDIGIAVVTFLRALLAIHAEFMFACMLLGLVVIAPHLWQHSLQVLKPLGWEPWLTPWWALATGGWLLLAPGMISGYWAARDGDAKPGAAAGGGWRTISLRDAALLVLAALVSMLVLDSLHASGALDIAEHALTWPTSAALALVSLVLGHALVQVWLAANREPRSLAVARLRNWLTRALRAVTTTAVALAALGVLDRLSWWVLEELQGGNDWLWGGVGFGGLAVLVLRALMQPLQQMAAESGARNRALLPRLLNLASLVGILALVLVWLVLLQWFVFAPDTFDTFVGVPAWMRAALVATGWLLWVLLTAGNAQMANTSSLHSFYRARLTRAYLAVGNRRRGLDDRTQRRADVTEVVEGDDTALAHHHPETVGGPIHLVNTCLNQTRDDASGLYNADRKGTAVTATWRGLEVGADKFIPADPAVDAGTLGRWVAVSGAAASPGAGSYTSRGLALLVYFLGVRLGHWVKAPEPTPALRWLSAAAWRFMPKPLMLASEASATFFGVDRPWWYLSDGGHFENTGVYALLKRELDFIILSDASCDADYAFGDLENLVRKARIDFGAEIDFYTREEAHSLFSLAGAELTVVSPEDMPDNHSCRGVMLARIRYRERPGPARADGSPGLPMRPEGTLLVVKPNLHDELDVDLLAYAQKHPSFPHESTGDQSFDEAQWESYHRLGEDFGRAMHDAWLSQLPGWRKPARHGMKVAARLRSAADQNTTAHPSAEPLWRRSARATALGTTLGLGASGTLLLSMWQVQDQLQRRQTEEQAEVRQMFTEASRGLQDFDGACPKLPDHVVTQTLRLLDLRGTPTLRPLEQGGVVRLADHLERECRKPAGAGAACEAAHERLHNDLCVAVVQQEEQGSALDYWRPGISPDDQLREAEQTLRHLAALWRREPRRDAAVGNGRSEAVTVVRRAEPVEQIEAAPAAAAPPPEASGSAVAARAPDPLEQMAAGMFAANAGVAEPAANATAAAVTAPQSQVAREAGALLAKACQGDSGATRLFVLVYDDETQSLATRWRQSLIDLQMPTGLRIPPVRNVTRNAELHQQRRPVPWPKPTLVMHDVSSRECAVALKRLLTPRLTTPPQGADDDGVWIRDLPEAQPNRRPGVIEFWWPTGSLGHAEASGGAAELIARFEGAVLAPYTDGAGRSAIGIGHVLSAAERASGMLLLAGEKVPFADGITATQARLLLEADLAPLRDGLAKIVAVDLRRNQREALVSLAFNIGLGTLQRSQLLTRLNEGDYDAVPAEMMRWTRVAGSPVPDLVKRREAEIALWNKP